MVRKLMMLSLLVASQFSLFSMAAEAPWYKEGFVENADGDTRVAKMRKDIQDGNVDYYLCRALEHAQLANSELYVEKNVACHDDKDCEVGTLGGFCDTAAHKVQIREYRVYTRSPQHLHISGEYKKNACHGPMGKCMQVTGAVCKKAKKDAPGACQAVRDEKHVLPTFMQ